MFFFPFAIYLLLSVNSKGVLLLRMLVERHWFSQMPCCFLEWHQIVRSIS